MSDGGSDRRAGRANNAVALDTARALTEGKGTLVFLTHFGSTLYGTRCEGVSDTDVYGLYVPDISPASPDAAKQQKTLLLSTRAGTGRNTSADMDVCLFPLDKWLTDLLPAANVAAQDILYAPTRPECTIVRDPALDTVFTRPLEFLGLDNAAALVTYCQGQGNTFGLAGTRFGALWRVWIAASQMSPKIRVGDVAAELIRLAGAAQYCSCAVDGGLLLAGQWHTRSTRMQEVAVRLAKLLDGHLARIEAARRNKDVDWKALAHAVRAIRQQESLLRDGTLAYPLPCAAELMPIRRGTVDFAMVEACITEGLRELEELRSSSPYARPADVTRAWLEARRVRAAVLSRRAPAQTATQSLP